MLAVVDSPTNKSTRPLAKEQKSLTDKAKDRLAASRFRLVTNDQTPTVILTIENVWVNIKLKKKF